MKKIKNMFSKITEKTILLLMVLSLTVNNIMPLVVVYAQAVTPFTITFQKTGSHTMEMNGDRLQIDGVVVEFHNANDDSIGDASCDDSKCQITNIGEEGSLIFGGGQFKLYNTDGHVAYNYETIRTSTVFNIEDPATNPAPGENPTNPENEIIVEFDGGNVAGNTVTFNVNDTDVTLTVSGGNIAGNELRFDRNNIADITFAIGNTYNSETMQIMVRGAEQYSSPLNVSNNSASLNGLNFPGNGLHLTIESKGGQGPVVDKENIEFDIAVTGTHVIAAINEKTIVDDFGGLKSAFVGTVENAGTTDPNGTNIIKIGAPFGESPLVNIKINNTLYTKTSPGVEINEEDNSYIITVPGAAKYTIRAEADTEAVVERTIIWANPDYVPTDEDDAEWAATFTLKHGTAEVVAVRDKNNRLLDPSEYVLSGSEPNGLKDGFGWVKVYPGYKVEFKFFPEYGYQLTEITLNETPMKAGEAMNTFTIEIPDDKNAGNVHFAATFTKTADIVKANSKKVSSGAIDLGNKLSGGSAQLTVNDIELSSDKIKGFKDAAGEYNISNYLDIDLYQVFNKGTTDSNNVWSNKISELDKYATITMKLDEGVNAADIVIVHNIHDGEEYEIIKIDSYDPETNTITFKTKSFSNYAIATKGTTLTTDSSNSDVEATIKTEKKLPDNSSLRVKEISISKNLLKKEKNLKKLLDISILSNSGEVIKVTDNKMQITISLDKELLGFNTYKIVYVNNGKIEETLPATVVDGKLTFETTHLSEYGIVAYNETTGNNPQTSDNIRMYINLFILSAGGFAISTLQLKKRRKLAKNN